LDEYRVTQAWTLVSEVVSGVGDRREPDTAVVRAGAVYAVTERLRMDAAVAAGLTRGSPDVLVTVGLTLAVR
jgi:hypothetical protein